MTETASGAIHARLVERFPALGELCFDAVLSELSQLAREAQFEGRLDLTRRAMGFAEWLADHGRGDLAEHAVSPLFEVAAAERVGAGPRVLALLRRR